MDSPKNYEPVKYKETQDISILFGDNVAQVDHESLVTMMALQHKVHEGRVFGVGYRNPTAGTVGWDVYVNPPSTGTLHVFAIVQSDGDCYYEAGWVSSVSPGSTTLTPANYNYESTHSIESLVVVGGTIESFESTIVTGLLGSGLKKDTATGIKGFEEIVTQTGRFGIRIIPDADDTEVIVNMILCNG